MRFDQFHLYDAIYEVRQKMLSNGESPSEEMWYVDDESRKEFCARVVSQMVIDCDPEIIEAAMRFRKSPKAEGTSVKKLDLLIQVARLHGRKCFYADRGLGLCSDDVHLDRILPGSKGGKYSITNCIIACGRHNSERSDRSIEEYLFATAVV